MKTLVRIRSFIIPACIGLLLVAAASFYNLVWLPSEHRYFDDRNFRLLTTLGDQISSNINNFDSMMDNAAESGVKEVGLKSYLKKVAPQVQKLEPDDREVIAGDYGDPPRIAVRADEGSHFLYFAFMRKDTKTKETTSYAIRTDLEKLIRNVLPPDNRNPFDVVLVAQGDGTVIFQKSAPGIAVARINSLEDATEPTKTSKSDADAKLGSDFAKFSFSKFTEINLAGDRFRLYSQPLQISLPSIDNARKGKSGSLAQPEQWTLCGLVRVEAFRSESQSISNTYLLWLSVAVLLVVASYPFLKLRVSSPAERMRAIDVVVTVVLTCVVTTTLTFALLDVYYSRAQYRQLGSEDSMKAIAKAIDDNFDTERQAALKQVDDFYHDSTLRNALLDEQRYSQPHPTFSGDEGGCNPTSACRTSILKKDGDVDERVWSYPYLEFATWSDFKGRQLIKWSVRNHVTPFINLDDPSITYYPAFKEAFAYGNPDGPTPVPTSGVGSQYSPNTGDYITVFWQMLEMGEETNERGSVSNANHKKASQRQDMKNLFCASVITRPISVVNPILPAEFQFAIIRHDGMVVYHSDPTRNLRENFFAEADQNQEVKSRVFTRAEGELVANYLGRGHRLYIHPMTHESTKMWTVIVFRDLRLEETTNLEVVSLASILFVLYAVMMAIALLALHCAGRGEVTGSWLWPDSRKAGTYKRLAAINIIGVLLLLVIPKLPGVLALLLCAIGIPIVAMTLNVLALRRRDKNTRSENTQWQLRYFSTLSTLLIVLAVLPCLSFFKVAWDFEQRLLIERSQLRLAADVDVRAEGVRAHYLEVELGPNVKRELLAGPDEKPNRYFSYHQSFLDTTIDSAPEGTAAQNSAGCGFGDACSQPDQMASFLSLISPLYNEIAYDGRYLTEATLGAKIWSSTSSRGREELKLTRHEPGKNVRIITSKWTPLRVPWGDWKWWLGALVYVVSLFWLVRFSLKKIFLLDFSEPEREYGEHRKLAESNGRDLLTKMSVNMVVIGRSSSPITDRVIQHDDVQAHDLYEMLTAHAAKISGRGNDSTFRNRAAEIAEIIKKNGRTVVFYNFERGLADPAIRQETLSTLERVLSILGRRVAIVSAVDPCSKLSGDEREQWERLLQSFVRIDMNSGPTKGTDETYEDFEARIYDDGYCNWLFSGRSEAQKLVLVQLAEEGLVNPNSWPDVRELMREGFVARKNGMLAIQGTGFLRFLKQTASCDIIKDMESHVVGRSNTLRMSLLVAGAVVVGFLLYTQGAVVNTWIAYATGLAASIPALLKVLEIIRRRPEDPIP